MKTGIRKLRDRLSHYVRRAEAGERIKVTAHGRVVAELGPPAGTISPSGDRIEELIRSGAIRTAAESGDPIADWPDLRLPRGTARALIDSDRD